MDISKLTIEQQTGILEAYKRTGAIPVESPTPEDLDKYLLEIVDLWAAEVVVTTDKKQAEVIVDKYTKADKATKAQVDALLATVAEVAPNEEAVAGGG